MLSNWHCHSSIVGVLMGFPLGTLKKKGEHEKNRNHQLDAHRSSSCLRVRLCALRAFSSACRLCSSARTSSSESPPAPCRSSVSRSPWETSSSLIRTSNERVCGTLWEGTDGGGELSLTVCVKNN